MFSEGWYSVSGLQCTGEKRRRRGGDLSPQFMSPVLSVMAAEGEREGERQGARED